MLRRQALLSLFGCGRRDVHSSVVFQSLFLYPKAPHQISERLSSSTQNGIEPVFLGEISFGIYIFQMPVLIISDSLLKRAGMADPTMLFFTYLVILGMVSALSFNLIETPLRRKINEFRIAPKPLAA